MKQIKVELQESMGSDRSIAEAAWTSSSDFQGKQRKTNEQVENIINMLANDKHATPFESVVFRFWIKMPIAIDRQHMTHRIGSHNGMSGRYRTMPTEFLAMPEDVESILNRINLKITEAYEHVCSLANSNYALAMKDLKIAKANNNITNEEYKRAREFIRGMLPQHNMTERVTVFNLRSFANYQKLRNSKHAQPEIQEVARQMLDAVKAANICPIALEALERNGWNI